MIVFIIWALCIVIGILLIKAFQWEAEEGFFSNLFYLLGWTILFWAGIWAGASVYYAAPIMVNKLSSLF